MSIRFPLEAGNILTELLNSFKNRFDGFDDQIDSLVLWLQTDTAQGSDLDAIGSLIGVKRLENETDVDYRVRINGYISVHDIRSTLQSLVNLATDIFGLNIVSIQEYPDIDFTQWTGKSKPGILALLSAGNIPSDKRLDQFYSDGQLYKPAGVPLIISFISQFTEHLTALEISAIFSGAVTHAFFTESPFSSTPPTVDLSHSFFIDTSEIGGSTGSNMVTNPGFESGNLGDAYNWTESGAQREPNGANGVPYAGSYFMLFFQPGEYTRYCEQTLSTSVDVDDISSFTFWLKSSNITSSPKMRVIVTYSDVSTTQHDYNLTTNYTQYLVTNLSAGKTITKIRFTSAGSGNKWLDEVEIVLFNQDIGDPLLEFEEKLV